MFNKAKKLFVIPMIAFVGLASLTVSMPQTVSAQTSVCTVFPFLETIGLFGIGSSLCGTTDASDTGAKAATAAANMIQLVLQLIFIGIIVVAVYVIIKSALKYIRSEGEEAKVQEAQKAIKTVFVGVAALFIGILGIVLVLAFFQASGAVDTENTQETGLPVIQQFLDQLFGRGSEE